MGAQEWVSVKVHPQAGKDVLVGVAPGRFEAWVRAKPLAGRANDAVIALLATHLGVAADRLRLIKGRAGRIKVFRILS
jgi:uncharacterized protein YggU (UPF0235/DUF167 family)